MRQLLQLDKAVQQTVKTRFMQGICRGQDFQRNIVGNTRHILSAARKIRTPSVSAQTKSVHSISSPLLSNIIWNERQNQQEQSSRPAPTAFTQHVGTWAVIFAEWKTTFQPGGAPCWYGCRADRTAGEKLTFIIFLSLKHIYYHICCHAVTKCSFFVYHFSILIFFIFLFSYTYFCIIICRFWEFYYLYYCIIWWLWLHL